MMETEINYDLEIKTKKDTFRFIVELKDLKDMLEKLNYKEIKSVELKKRDNKCKILKKWVKCMIMLLTPEYYALIVGIA